MAVASIWNAVARVNAQMGFNEARRKDGVVENLIINTRLEVS
jgi:hypothetical protein